MVEKYKGTYGQQFKATVDLIDKQINSFELALERNKQATQTIIQDIRDVFRIAKDRLTTISFGDTYFVPMLEVPRKLETYCSQDYLPEKKQTQDFEHPPKD